MLEARELTYTINGSTLLAGIDIAVAPGRIAVLIGPNGAGKSTLLRALAGELAPTQGSVKLDGQDLQSFTPAELAGRRAVVPQGSLLAFPFTVLEVAMLGVTVPGFTPPGAAARATAMKALDVVGLSHIADRLYVHLSGGERQRVHFARALCQLETAPAEQGATRCFLLDEPTSSLDLAHQAEVLRAAHQQARRGHAVIAVLHDLNLAAALADELVLLVHGRVAACGTAAQVLSNELLSAAYGCQVHINRTPPDDRPFILPPAIFLREPDAAHPAVYT